MDPDSSSQFGSVITVLVVSLAFSGLISAYEASLSDLSSMRLEKRAEEGDQKSAYLLSLIKNPHHTLLTLMVSDWLADVTVLMLSAYLIFHALEPWAWWHVAVAIFTLTPALLILGEIIPKNIASRYGESFAYAWLPMLKLLLMVFSVPVRVLGFVTRPLLESVGAQLGQLLPDFTEDEILHMVNMGGTTGLLEKDETELVQHALNFDDTPASAVLTPRVDMMCLEDTVTLEEALTIMAEPEGYSRLPVYRDNHDNILGIVYIKDLLSVYQKHPEQRQNAVIGYVRKAHHIHEYQPINEVLKEMQSLRTPMFIVTDEYGGTVGLITMEDLLEEIVGELHDEFDHDEESPIEKLDMYTLRVDAKVSVTEINNLLDLDLPNSQSVGGLVFSTLGEAPGPGEVIHLQNVRLEVEAVDGIRILRVRVQKLTTEELETLATEESLTSPSS